MTLDGRVFRTELRLMTDCYVFSAVFAVDWHPVNLPTFEHAATFSLFVWNRIHKKNNKFRETVKISQVEAVQLTSDFLSNVLYFDFF